MRGDNGEFTLRRIPGTAAWACGPYLFWQEARRRWWRWARREWRDDGIGIQHHGAAETIEAALEQAEAHDALYESV